MRAVFVHGACVRDGAWWWSRVAALLRTEGVESIAVPLPSCGETGRGQMGHGQMGHGQMGRGQMGRGQMGRGQVSMEPGTDGPALDEDVAEVRRVLRDAGPAVVVGHSYGGIVATEAVGGGEIDHAVGGGEIDHAAGATAVDHLVYISSFLPEVGESLASFGDGTPAPYLDFAADGTFGVRPEMVADLFLHDCDREAVDGAFARLARQTAAVTTQPVRHAGWKQIPSTYLVCAEDRATPPALQRAQAARADRVLELPTGHHPFLSCPDLVARAVLDLR